MTEKGKKGDHWNSDVDGEDSYKKRMGAKRWNTRKHTAKRRQPVQRQEPPRIDTDGNNQELRVAESLNEMTARKKERKQKKKKN